MCNSLYERVRPFAQWRVIVFLILTNFVCMSLFNWRHRQLNNIETPDSMRHYTPEQLTAFFMSIGENGRRLYALTQITLDVAYPAVYGLLFATLLVILFPWAKTRCIVLLPLLSVLFDLLENFTTAYLAWTFDGLRTTNLGRIAPIFSTGKWWGVTLSLAAIALGAVLKLVSLLRSKTKS